MVVSPSNRRRFTMANVHVMQEPWRPPNWVGGSDRKCRFAPWFRGIVVFKWLALGVSKASFDVAYDIDQSAHIKH